MKRKGQTSPLHSLGRERRIRANLARLGELVETGKVKPERLGAVLAGELGIAPAGEGTPRPQETAGLESEQGGSVLGGSAANYKK